MDLECAAGKEGLLASPGLGLEHVQIVVEWAMERHIALVCFRNNSMAEPQFTAVPDKEEREFSVGKRVVRAWKHMAEQ